MFHFIARGWSGKLSVICVIQARMGSARLPGKVAMDIAGKSMLERVVERASLIQNVDRLFVATSHAIADDKVEHIAEKLGVSCHRGSESDVLRRYWEVAAAEGADDIVRITADCPLLDPEVSSLVLERYLTVRPDYASNTIERTYPRGLDTEVFSFSSLEQAHREATGLSDREHVTRFIWRQPNRFNLLNVKGSVDFSIHRWTVDQPRDLEFVRRIYQLLGENVFGMNTLFDLLNRHPDLSRINTDHTHKRT
jgi:spore coat polysaccharide biosynthesis protein SpsF